MTHKCKHVTVNPKTGSLLTSFIDDGQGNVVCHQCGLKMTRREFEEKKDEKLAQVSSMLDELIEKWNEKYQNIER